MTPGPASHAGARPDPGGKEPRRVFEENENMAHTRDGVVTRKTHATPGTLCDYQTSEALRDATQAETEESIAQATRDGGAGVILVDGRSCYVEGGAIRAQAELDALPPVTDSDIRALSTEAAEAGDTEQVAQCESALAGEPGDRRRCTAVIQYARMRAAEVAS